MKTPLAAAFAATLALLAVPAFAADHEVKMLNKGAAGVMVFEPAALHVQPGDTVTFLATDPGHNVEFIAGMFPEGVEAFRSTLGKDVTITFDVPGVYGVKCTPHLAMGMVGVIKVGDDPHNIEAVKGVRQPPVAGQRLAAAYETLGL
ncbi:pseudoazurin [Pelagibacterium limicola]|uniref:pseudoazurin n=1 Tax=Pelagibacterium limicola TaxID=2791022 RepID=UPI0018AF94E4|nr:pseudoazurin [Pelagibacterium limicola]